jgi:hypothetical protein
VSAAFVLSSVGSGLVTARSPVQGVLPTAYRKKKKSPHSLPGIWLLPFSISPYIVAKFSNNNQIKELKYIHTIEQNRLGMKMRIAPTNYTAILTRRFDSSGCQRL